jgi:hypothetical protein
MDNNMIIMNNEVEKLRAELANAEKRARAAMVAAANPSNLTFLFVHLKCLLSNTTEIKIETSIKVCVLNLWSCFYAGPGYHANNPDMGFGGITYPPDSYSMHQVCCMSHPNFIYFLCDYFFIK